MITDVFTAVSAHALLSTTVSKLGAEFLAEADAPPKVIWVPTSDSFQPGSRQTSTSNTVAKEPRQIGIRTAGVRVRVWAAGDGTPAGDIAAVEALLQAFLVAVHETTYGSYRVQTMAWVNADGGELEQLGRACDVSLTFDIPVVKPARTTATLTTITYAEMTGVEGLPSGDVSKSPAP